MTNAIDNARKALDAYDQAMSHGYAPNSKKLAFVLRDLLDSLEYEYAGIPITSTGAEWVQRSIEACKELVREHADPAHWVHEPRNSDLDYVVTYRVIRRIKAGEWEKIS